MKLSNDFTNFENAQQVASNLEFLEFTEVGQSIMGVILKESSKFEAHLMLHFTESGEMELAYINHAYQIKSFIEKQGDNISKLGLKITFKGKKALDKGEVNLYEILYKELAPEDAEEVEKFIANIDISEA